MRARSTRPRAHRPSGLAWARWLSSFGVALLGVGLPSVGCGPRAESETPTTPSSAASTEASASAPSAAPTAQAGPTAQAAPSTTAPTLRAAPPGAAVRRRDGKCFIVEHLSGGPGPAPWRESEVQCPAAEPP